MKTRRMYACDHCEREFEDQSDCVAHEAECMGQSEMDRKLKTVLEKYGLTMDETPEGEFVNFDDDIISYLLNEEEQKRFLLVWNISDSGEGTYQFFASEALAVAYLEGQIQDNIENWNQGLDLEDCYLYDSEFNQKFDFSTKTKVTVKCRPLGKRPRDE